MIDEWFYIRENLSKGQYRLLGYGSARRVFDLNNGYVVKVAKNRKGIAQNIVEFQISRESLNPIIARIICISEDARYLIMEKVERLRNFSYVLQYYNVNSISELLTKANIIDLFEHYHIVISDLHRMSNWGITNGRPVVIDYGFTLEIRKKFYNR